jgi:hypothetical protein
MTNQNLTQSILHRVADDKLQPKPHWQFVIRQILVWFGVLISIIIGSLSSSVMVFLVVNNDWEIYDSITNSLARFILLTLPYFWLILFAIFIALGYFYTRHTKHGYRYNIWHLAIIYTSLCIIIGGTVYAFDGDKEIDNLLTVNVPIYRQLVNQQTNRWQQPQLGLLAGDVESVNSNKKEFTLDDNEEHLWQIDYSQVKLNRQVKLIRNERLQLVGIKNDDNHFTAKKILVAKPTLHKRTKQK